MTTICNDIVRFAIDSTFGISNVLVFLNFELLSKLIDFSFLMRVSLLKT